VQGNGVSIILRFLNTKNFKEKSFSPAPLQCRNPRPEGAPSIYVDPEDKERKRYRVDAKTKSHHASHRVHGCTIDLYSVVKYFPERRGDEP
jgi:hypothetical protein